MIGHLSNSDTFEDVLHTEAHRKKQSITAQKAAGTVGHPWEPGDRVTTTARACARDMEQDRPLAFDNKGLQKLYSTFRTVFLDMEHSFLDGRGWQS